MEEMTLMGMVCKEKILMYISVDYPVNKEEMHFVAEHVISFDVKDDEIQYKKYGKNK